MDGEIRKVKITREVLINSLELGYTPFICSRLNDPVRSYRPIRKSTMELLNDFFGAYIAYKDEESSF